jgi:ferredoxin
VDADLCAGCETCADHRPQEAIELLREPGQGELLEIQKLMDHAAR